MKAILIVNSKSCLLLAPLTLFLLLPTTLYAQPYGIGARASNTTLLISGDPPDSLSDLTALLNAGLGTDQTAQGILPYEPSAKLWSDGAIKERFIAIPALGQVTYQAEGAWDFPDNTVLIKNFLLPQDFRDPEGTAKRIETRLLIRDDAMDLWSGYSYKWNEGETDANLLPYSPSSTTRSFSLIDKNGVSFDYDWVYPSRLACSNCHTEINNRIAGITTAQLNSDFLYPGSGVTDNQMRTFEHINLFDDTLPAPINQLPSAPDPRDTTATTVQRAEAYVLANCSMCHRPGGSTGTNIDWRWGTPLGSRNVFNVVPTNLDETFGIQNPKLFAPGDPLSSIIHWRIFTLGSYRMPPLATSLMDVDADNLIMAWITLMTTVDGPNTIWVDFATGTPEFGTFDDPFDTLREGLKNVASGGTVKLLPGDSPETLTIAKPVRLESTGGPVRLGTP